MAHWAQIDENNIVVSVIVTENNDDEGQGWISENLQGTWLKTSYNTRFGKHLFGREPFRKNFAQPGYYYDNTLDAFIPPKMLGREDFVLDTEAASWIPPLPFPEDATWVLEFQDMPEGHDELQEKRVYYWMNDYKAWGLIPCDCMPPPEGEYYWNPLAGAWEQPNSEKPSAEHYWHSIDKEWQLPPSEKPDGDYSWLPIEQQWVEIITEQ